MRIGSKFAVLALVTSSTLLLAVAASAQFNGFSNTTFGGATIHGVPPSVTSFGFGGTPGFHGVPASVTSLNFGNTPFRFRPAAFGFGHHWRQFGLAMPFYGGYYGGSYYIPYDYPLEVLEPGVDDSMEQDYNVGSTIFDHGRRGYPARAAVEDY